jgi:hypothetical protein
MPFGLIVKLTTFLLPPLAATRVGNREAGIPANIKCKALFSPARKKAVLLLFKTSCQLFNCYYSNLLFYILASQSQTIITYGFSIIKRAPPRVFIAFYRNFEFLIVFNSFLNNHL